MSDGRTGWRIALGCVGVLAAMVAATASASATGVINLCIGSKSGQGVKSGGEGAGKCPLPTEKVTYKKVALPIEESEQQKLLAILPHIKYIEGGVGGKPTIQFSGANVQVVNGEGTTGSVNGAGNLVIGYNELPGAQTGSHNLILGEAQEFTSFGGILGGQANTISGPFASVTGGRDNTASALDASVSGGFFNKASGEFASSVSGGQSNTASGLRASVSGGVFNLASGEEASVSGGAENTASGIKASISGGLKNSATGKFTSILGGKEGVEEAEFGHIP